MKVHCIDVAKHSMKLRHRSVYHGWCKHAVRVGNHPNLLKVSALEQPVSHCSDSATVLGPYVYLAIHNESGDSLPRTPVLHARFQRIDGKSRADDGLFQFVSNFPLVWLASSTSGDALRKIGLVRGKRDVVGVSRIGAAICGC